MNPESEPDRQVPKSSPVGKRPLHLLLLSTPVGPIGSGRGGGVELTLRNLLSEMDHRGHRADVVAPSGSLLEGANLIQLDGALQPPFQQFTREDHPPNPENSVLTRMLQYAREHQYDYDLIVSFAYDWLPIYLTPSFDIPLLHYISMSSMNNTMDREIGRLASSTPGRLACYSRTQAETFPHSEKFTVLGGGIDLDRYKFHESTENKLVWLGRISREKGLEDACEAARQAGSPLKVMGKLEQEDYWEEIRDSYSKSEVEYLGFLPTEAMQQQLGPAKALLMTSRWTEAFGLVAVEALACGVPVISYNHGGPSEIVDDGRTGFLTTPGRIGELVHAIGRLESIDRQTCRFEAEKRFSLRSWGDRVEAWLLSALQPTAPGTR